MEYVSDSLILKNSITIPKDNNYRGTKVYDSIVKALEKLKEIINSSVEKIVHKEEQSTVELILNIKKSFESIENILIKEPIYEEEYFSFASIKDMAFYILDDTSLHAHVHMITDLIRSFFNAIQFKKGTVEEYKREYGAFSSLLSDYEEKFYTEIYQPSEHYDEETLGKITNSLLNL